MAERIHEGEELLVNPLLSYDKATFREALAELMMKSDDGGAILSSLVEGARAHAEHTAMVAAAGGLAPVGVGEEAVEDADDDGTPRKLEERQMQLSKIYEGSRETSSATGVEEEKGQRREGQAVDSEVESVDDDPGPDLETLRPLVGRWKIHSEEGRNPYLKAMGLPFAMRSILSVVAPPPMLNYIDDASGTPVLHCLTGPVLGMMMPFEYGHNHLQEKEWRGVKTRIHYRWEDGVLVARTTANRPGIGEQRMWTDVNEAGEPIIISDHRYQAKDGDEWYLFHLVYKRVPDDGKMHP